MTDNREDGAGADQTSTVYIPKPWVIPAPQKNLNRIFGSSQVFVNIDDKKAKETGLTVPLKLREYYVRGKQCLEEKNWEMAVLFFSRALHLDPELVDFYILRAEAYTQLCDFSSAVQNLRKAYYYESKNLSIVQRLSLVLYLKGQCLFEQCSFQEALKYFVQASKLQPQQACFRYRCMASFLALGQLDNCLSYINKEVKQGMASADLYILRARIYNSFKKPNLCYRDLHKAMQLDAQHPEAKTLLKVLVSQSQRAREEAGILAVQGKLSNALQRINCAIENNPLDPSFFLFRGTMYRRMQDFDAAVEDFLKALDMVTEGHEETVQQAQHQLLLAYNDFALHCYKQGAYQEGVLLLNKALKDQHLEKGLYINRGDCFFQLGNLVFAEADYQQALALSPQDEGAKMRMGLLQEKLGFCEQKRRHFDKAETHFSIAIQHNPEKIQNYLFRAKTRQFLQNTFGARQDVATALLLDPQHPKLVPLLEKLFPGMSVEEVLRSKVCRLAQEQLRQRLEGNARTSLKRCILGKQDLELQDMEQQQKLPLETPEVDKSMTQVSQVEPRNLLRKERRRLALNSKILSSSNSYPDSAFSNAIMGSDLTAAPGLFFQVKVRSSPETSETSTMLWDYKSTSTMTTKGIQSSDVVNPSQNPRKNKDWKQTPSKTKPPLGQSQSPYKIQEPPQGRNRRPILKEDAGQGLKHKYKNKGVPGSRQRLRKVKAAQDWGWQLIQEPPNGNTLQDPAGSPENTKVIPAQNPGQNEVTEENSQNPIKIKVTYSCTLSPGKIEIAQSPSKAEATPDQGLSSTKTEATQYYSQSDSRTQATVEESLGLSKSEAPQGQSSEPSKTETTQSNSQNPIRPKATQNQSLSPSKSKVTRSLSPNKSKGPRSLSPNKHKATRSLSPSKSKVTQSLSPSKSKVTQNHCWSSGKPKITRNQSPSPSKSRVTWSLSPSKSKVTRSRSPSPGKTMSPKTSETSKTTSRSRGKTKVVRNLSRQ